jgi:hypothetical protein
MMMLLYDSVVRHLPTTTKTYSSATTTFQSRLSIRQAMSARSRPMSQSSQKWPMQSGADRSLPGNDPRARDFSHLRFLRFIEPTKIKPGYWFRLLEKNRLRDESRD